MAIDKHMKANAFAVVKPLLCPKQREDECMQGNNKAYSMAVKLSKSRQKSTHVKLLQPFDPYPSCNFVVLSSRIDHVDFIFKTRPLPAGHAS